MYTLKKTSLGKNMKLIVIFIILAPAAITILKLLALPPIM